MVSRLKFNIDSEIDRKFEKLPTYIWESDSTTFCDLQMGGGQYIRKYIEWLRKFGHSDANIGKRVFGFSEKPIYLNYLKSDSTLIGTFNEYNGNINMKFDVVAVNPPYQSDSDNVGAGHTIWNKFVSDILNKHLKNDGFACFITPGGWRNISGDFDSVKQDIKKRDLIYLEIHDISDGLKLFKKATRYDLYIVKNSKTENFKTECIDEIGNVSNINIDNLNFISNRNINILNKIIASSNEETVEMCFSHSNYDPRKKWMSDTKTDDFSLPCIKYISKNDNTLDLRYSSIDKGMFGKPKVLFGIGSQVGGIFIDIEGKYGLCQFVAGIVDTSDNLPKIQKALLSQKFIDVMKSCQFTTQQYNYKIISTFRKDFWKEFI